MIFLCIRNALSLPRKTRSQSLQFKSRIKLLFTKPSFILLSILFCIFTFFSCRSMDADLYNLRVEYYFLAEEYVKIEKYDKALELFQKSLSDSDEEKDVAIMFTIARTAALAKDWTVALQNYNELLLLDPDNLSFLKSIAWIYAQKGDLKMAHSKYTDLYTIHGYDDEILTNYALILLALEYYDDATAVLTSYAELYPEAENLEELNILLLNNEEADTILEDQIEETDFLGSDTN